MSEVPILSPETIALDRNPAVSFQSLVRMAFMEDGKGRYRADRVADVLRLIVKSLGILVAAGEVPMAGLRESYVGDMSTQTYRGFGGDSRRVVADLLCSQLKQQDRNSGEHESLWRKLGRGRDLDLVVDGDPWEVLDQVLLTMPQIDDLHERGVWKRGGEARQSRLSTLVSRMGLGQEFGLLRGIFSTPQIDEIVARPDGGNDYYFRFPVFTEERDEAGIFLREIGSKKNAERVMGIKISKGRFPDTGKRFVEFAVQPIPTDQEHNTGRWTSEENYFLMQWQSTKKQASKYNCTSWSQVVSPLRWEGIKSALPMIEDRIGEDGKPRSTNNIVVANLYQLSKPLGELKARDDGWFQLSPEGWEIINSPLEWDGFEELSLGQRMEAIFRLLPQLVQGESRLKQSGAGIQAMEDFERGLSRTPALSSGAYGRVRQTLVEASADDGWLSQVNIDDLKAEAIIAYTMNPVRMLRYFRAMGLADFCEVEEQIAQLEDRAQLLPDDLVEQVNEWMQPYTVDSSSAERMYDDLVLRMQANSPGQTEPRLLLRKIAFDWLVGEYVEDNQDPISFLEEVFSPKVPRITPVSTTLSSLLEMQRPGEMVHVSFAKKVFGLLDEWEQRNAWLSPIVVLMGTMLAGFPVVPARVRSGHRLKESSLMHLAMQRNGGHDMAGALRQVLPQFISDLPLDERAEEIVHRLVWGRDIDVVMDIPHTWPLFEWLRKQLSGLAGNNEVARTSSASVWELPNEVVVVDDQVLALVECGREELAVVARLSRGKYPEGDTYLQVEYGYAKRDASMGIESVQYPVVKIQISPEANKYRRPNNPFRSLSVDRVEGESGVAAWPEYIAWSLVAKSRWSKVQQSVRSLMNAGFPTGRW